MKKILLLIALFGSLFASAQIPGYTFTNAKYERLDEIFRALGLPGGDSAQFRTGQAQRQGAIYFDTTNNNTPAGLYVYYNGAWVLQGQSTSIELPDEILFGGSVTPEGGFRFSVQEAIYRIDNVIYTSDSGTVIVDSSDATFDRKDKLYFGTDGQFHVLKGIPSEAAAEPQLLGDQLEITVVDIEAGAIQANISTINVYFENDATITPSGTTAVGNSTAAPYAGTYHIRITTNNNGDFVDIIKTSGTWDISGQDFLSIHIKNRAVIPQLANWRVSLWNGASTGSQVSGEVILNYNKNNSTTYQAISIPMSAFQTITNTNIDRIRLRYTSNNATNHAGIDLDNIFFGDNLQQPGGGGVNSVDVSIDGTALSVSGPSTGAVNKTFAWQGNSTQYIRGDGTLATFSAVTTVGAFGSQASNSNGLVISGVNIYGQPVTSANPGMTTPAMKASWDSSYYVQNLGNGLEIARAVDAATTGLRSLVFIGADTSASNDSTLIIEITGGGGGQRFGVEDDLQAEDRTFVTSGDLFRIRGEAEMIFASSNPGNDSVFLSMYNQEISLYAADDVGFASSRLYMNLSEISFDQSAGVYKFDALPDSITGTNYMMVWDAATDQIHKAAIPAGGGGGSGTVNTGAANRLAYYPGAAALVDDLAAITANSLLASDANGLPVAVTGVSDTEAGYLNGVTSAIQTQLDGKVSNNFATGNLTLTGTRAHSLSGNRLDIQDGGENLLTFDPSIGISEMGHYNSTGPSSANINFHAESTIGAFDLISQFAGNDQKIHFYGDATATEALSSWIVDFGGVEEVLHIDMNGSANTISHTAGTHSFVSGGETNGVVSLGNSFLRAFDATDDDNIALLSAGADASSSSIGLSASFNGGAEQASINLNVESGLSEATYSAADGHTFTGNLLTATNNTYDIGSAAASFKDIYARRLLLDGSTSGTSTIQSDALGNALNGTTLSGTGYLPATMYSKLRSDFTGSNVNTVQPVFDPAQDVLTLQGSTTYRVKGFYYWTHGAASHAVGISFELGGGASVTSVDLYLLSQIVAPGTVSSAQQSNYMLVSTNTAINAAGLNGVEMVSIEGWITMNAGGTVTPSYTFSAAPGGTCLTKAGSYIEFTPVGTNTAISLGNVN